MFLNLIIFENSQMPIRPNNDISRTYDSLEKSIAEINIKT